MVRIYTSAGMVYFNDYYTLINGTHSETITAPFNHISISLGAGNDLVKVHDIDVPWDLSMRLGVGADTADIRNVSVGDDLRIYPEGVYDSGRDMITILQAMSQGGLLIADIRRM